jgi:hypothetical protein
VKKRTIDAVVLGTSLFAAVALFGAAVTTLGTDRSSGSPRALIGSTSRPAPVAVDTTATPLDAARVEQALAPFVPADAHEHAGLNPMLEGDAHQHSDTGTAGDANPADGHTHDDGSASGAAHPSGHNHGGDTTSATVIADGNNWKDGPFEGSRIQWEPAVPNQRGSAMRIVNENDVVHDYSPSDAECAGNTPTTDDADYGAWLVAQTHEVLQRYRNRPDLALADGFVPYPLGNRYWHMINFSRLRTSNYVASSDPREGSSASEVLNPAGLESFIYGMVDGAGLVPLGGMYMYDQKDLTPPAPFGCLTAWHRHQGSQGFITSFDPQDPRSVWMVHVWDLAAIGPWGEHDGAHASEWWLGWRYLPNVCHNDDCL